MLDILPFFGTMGVADISASTLDDYLANLGQRKQLSPSTLSKHLIVIRKVMIEAQRRGFINSSSPFPDDPTQRQPKTILYTRRVSHVACNGEETRFWRRISVRGVP